jgi:pimeloyl-ACP methyl ester carboxylesterase
MRALLALESVEAAEVYTDLGGGRLFHLELGSGRPLVLLQGAGGGAANWYRLLGPLAVHRRVLAPELPGFGLSDSMDPRPPLGERAAWVLEGWLKARVGTTPFDLVTTSFGGLVALRLASRLPEQLQRLVLLNSTGLGRAVCLPARVAGLPGARVLTERPSRTGTAILLRTLLTTDRSRLPPDHRAALTDYLWHVGRTGAGEETAKSLAMFAGIAGQREVLGEPDLRGIRCRTLIVWGSRDRFLPARHGRRAASWIPHAAFHELQGVGHSPNWEHPVGVLDRIGPFLGVA